VVAVPSSSWSPLPPSSVAALRDVERFIATYRVSPPPPLIHSPPEPSNSADHTSPPVLPASVAQLQSSASMIGPRETVLQLSGTAAAEVLPDCRSDVDRIDTVQQQRDESISPVDAHSRDAAFVIYGNVLFDHSDDASPPSSQGVSCSPVPCVPAVDRWSTDAPSLNERGSLTASDIRDGGVVSFPSVSGFPPTDCAFRNYSAERDGSVSDPVATDPPRSSVATLAQQLDAYWAQRGETVGGCRTALQHDQVGGVGAVSRPSAPPPAPPPGSPLTTVDRSAADFYEQLTTQTLPRAASTRSLQAPPPRPPPRAIAQNSNNTSTLLGRSLPPEPMTGMTAPWTEAFADR